MFATRCPPIQAIVNVGIRIPKKHLSVEQPEQVCDMQRTIHLFPAFTQGLLRAGNHQTIRDKPYEFQFGAIPGKQREEAILIQMLNRHKCAENGLCFMSRFFDVANDFYCCNHEQLVEWHQQSSNIDFNMCLSSLVVENNVSFLSCADHDLFMSAESGVPPGLHTATNMFNWLYGQTIAEYIKK
eukprot:2144074-Karenia_brevis.AAC.1